MMKRMLEMFGRRHQRQHIRTIQSTSEREREKQRELLPKCGAILLATKEETVSNEIPLLGAAAAAAAVIRSAHGFPYDLLNTK